MSHRFKIYRSGQLTDPWRLEEWYDPYPRSFFRRGVWTEIGRYKTKGEAERHMNSICKMERDATPMYYDANGAQESGW